MTIEAVPFRTPIQCQVSEGRQVHPDQRTIRCCMRCSGWNETHGRSGHRQHRPSEITRSLGVVQEAIPTLP